MKVTSLLSFALLVAASPALAQQDDGLEVQLETDQEGDTPATIGRKPAAPVPPVNAPPADPPASAPTSPAKPERATTSKTNPAYTTLPDQPWRQSALRRSDDRTRAGVELRHVLAEVRFGPYFPKVDAEFGGAATPYADYFGDGAKFYFGIELDWLPLRIPYVGSLGVAYGWGTVRASAKAITASGDEAGSDTSLQIFPMYGAAVLRLDALLRHGYFPVAPYVKAGVGLGVWKASGPDGTSQTADGVEGVGTTAGFHLGLGGALALNAFDPHTAQSMREESGIRYAYLWGEWMLDDLTGYVEDDVMLVGTSTGIVGLGLEF